MGILAIDPGKTTGLALLSSAHGSLSDRVRAWYEPYEDAIDTCTGHATFVDVIVMEDFIISERTLRTGTANWRRGMELEFIGVMRWMCRRNDTNFVLQTPAKAKTFATDQKLKAAGLWTPGLDHPRDATRHLLTYLVGQRLIDPRELLADE